MKHHILALCLAFSAVNVANASQRAQDLPLNPDSMIMRLGNAVDNHVRKNFTSRIEKHGIKFESMVDASQQTLAHAVLFRLDAKTPEKIICFKNIFGVLPETICTEKQHLAALFAQKSVKLDETGANVQTRISAPQLQPIIEQSIGSYSKIINRIDEIKKINSYSHQQILAQL
jgi:hypothetical protein